MNTRMHARDKSLRDESRTSKTTSRAESQSDACSACKESPLGCASECSGLQVWDADGSMRKFSGPFSDAPVSVPRLQRGKHGSARDWQVDSLAVAFHKP
eukprot:1180528-Prorocentrum_minimum.AAC.2